MNASVVRDISAPEVPSLKGLVSDEEWDMRVQLAAAKAKEPDLRASRIWLSALPAMFEEGREKFLDDLRKAGMQN